VRFAVHVVYHQNRKTELLRDCALPLAEEIAALPGVELCTVDRQWRFGPHVRICVRAAGRDVEPAVVARAVPRVEAWLQAHPSREVLDEAAYARLSERLGTVELVPPPYGPLRPDNTVFVAGYSPREELIGPPAAVEFYERLQARALGPIRRLHAAAAGSDTRRLDYVLRVMVLLAASYPSGVFSGQLSYRSHLEDFLFDHDRAGTLRALLARKFAAQEPALVARVRALLDELVELTSVTERRIPYELERLGQKVYRGPDPVLRAWSDLFEQAWTDALPLADAGALTEEPGRRQARVAAGVNAEALAKWTVTPDREWSPFHTSLRKLDNREEWVQLLEFSSYRWIVNTFYVLLPLLDVSPRDRYFLQWLVVHAVEAIAGRTWKQHLDAALEAAGVGA
jgi:hypothetical protein